ncbi:rhomboid family intramembrane serine protease [Radiobacillus kanasensis]|uniref:rhomboid family intramembrane serine protease n=1 Tax=Radiobacillus kanasensis TaxID=2844358 RepID=UPI001E5AF178|nr:rhomboid family intramembrane serine protease [Radiobacillus kanasensis]UFT99817.1 rhomboid family intramembrane serine protease [Radiobacillus kanasensis]
MFVRTESFKQFIRLYPIVTSLIAIQLAIWVLILLFPFGEDIIYQWGVGFNPLIHEGQYWRLVTAIFIHDPNGIMHVLFNCFSLVLFGPALEQMLGKFKFLFVFLFTGIFGNFFTYIMEPTQFTIHFGASGAIYGILGLYLYMIFFRKHLIDPSSSQIIVVILVIGVLMSFFRPNINIAAHIFGLIGGFALGPIIVKNVQAFNPWRKRRVRDDSSVSFDPNRWNKRRIPWKKYLTPLLWGLIVLLGLLGLIGGIL